MKLEDSAEQHTILKLARQVFNRDCGVPHVARVDPPDQARLIKLCQLFTSLLRLHSINYKLYTYLLLIFNSNLQLSQVTTLIFF